MSVMHAERDEQTQGSLLGRHTDVCMHTDVYLPIIGEQVQSMASNNMRQLGRVQDIQQWSQGTVSMDAKQHRLYAG